VTLMSLYITTENIYSDSTPHTARRVTTADDWELSWLPARRFTHNQAVTAMVTAEELAKEPGPRERIWWHIETWMSQLALEQSEWPWPDQTESFGLDQAEHGWWS
jgi:hypothetical protein